MITICPTCSGVDSEKLEKLFGKENVTCTCLGECGGKDGIVLGFIEDKFVEVESEDEFIKLAQE